MKNVTIDDDISKQEDMTYVSKVRGTKADYGKVGVPLEMKHALVQVQLNAKNTNPNYVYKVKGFRLNNVVSNGDFDFKNEEWNANGKGNIKYKTLKLPTTLP